MNGSKLEQLKGQYNYTYVYHASRTHGLPVIVFFSATECFDQYMNVKNDISIRMTMEDVFRELPLTVETHNVNYIKAFQLNIYRYLRQSLPFISPGEGFDEIREKTIELLKGFHEKGLVIEYDPFVERILSYEESVFCLADES